jgi:hypothetical protein
MLRYAYPGRCPDCQGTLPKNPWSCPSCDLPLHGPLAQDLFRTLQRADVLLHRLRTEVTVAAPAPAPEPSPAPVIVPTLAPAPQDTAAAPVRRTGLRTASVPTILLSLGALCLLVAAITFLAVAWSWMGVGGRTGVLVGLTAATAGAGVLLGRRGLRVAAESLTTVCLGLSALDVVGAISAGWLGSPDDAGSTALVGAGIALVSGAILATRSRLFAPELGVLIGLMLALTGLAVTTGYDGLVAFGAVIALVVTASLAILIDARVLAVTAALTAVGWWLWLLLTGLESALSHPSLNGLWTTTHALPLLGAATLLLAATAAPYPAPAARAACASGAASILTLLLALPALDEGLTAIGLAVLVALVVWTGLAAAWSRPVALGPLVLAGIPAMLMVAGLVSNATFRAASVGDPFASAADVRLDVMDQSINPLLLVPLVAALLAAGWVTKAFPRARLVAAAALAAAATATLASYAVPLAVVVAVLVVAAFAVAWSGHAPVAVGTAVVAIGAALPSAMLTLVACACAVILAALLLRAGTALGTLLGGMLLPAASAGLMWSGAEVAHVSVDQRAVPVLVVLGLIAIGRPRIEVEATAAVGGLVAALASLEVAPDLTTLLVIQLTVAGALVTVSSLVHQDRRVLAWPGAALLAAALGVGTDDVGVTVVAETVAVALAVLLLLARNSLSPLVGGMLLPVASAELVWSTAAAAGVSVDLRALPVLVVVGALAIARPRSEVEASAAVAGFVAAVVSVDLAADPLTALAINLTVAGALVTLSSLLHTERRVFAWPGGALLAAATWVRLADLGVEAPEAYTLPSALVLIMVALDRLRRHPGTSTAVLLPGLTLGTVPTLLWVLVDPGSPRAVLLGLACLGLVLVGTRLGWSAPLAVGAVVGGLLVVREVAPYASEMPQWVLIGFAGTILTVVGVTWEQRVMELRRATSYLGRLR